LINKILVSNPKLNL